MMKLLCYRLTPIHVKRNQSKSLPWLISLLNMNHGFDKILNGVSTLLYDEEDEHPLDSKEVPLFNEITKDLNFNFFFSMLTTMDSGKNLESFVLTHKPIII